MGFISLGVLKYVVFVSCVHPVAVLNAAFCMTCSLLMLVEDAMLFSVCSAVTVKCCVLYLCCMGVFGMFTVMYGRRLFSSVFAITERRDMGLYEVTLSVSLLGFGIGTMLANFHV